LLLERSLAARPDAFNVKASLASFHLRHQRTDEAARLANEALREAPWYSQTYFVLGQVALNQNRIADAKKIFTKAAARSPREAYPLAALGYIADEIEHDTAAAKKFYRDALQRRWSENSGTAALNLAVLLATEGKIAESRKLMESVLPRMTDNPDLLRNLAIACKQLGDLPAAEAYHARFQRLEAAGNR
jgi:Flp pilus assembly protein TadD